MFTRLGRSSDCGTYTIALFELQSCLAIGSFVSMAYNRVYNRNNIVMMAFIALSVADKVCCRGIAVQNSSSFVRSAECVVHSLTCGTFPSSVEHTHNLNNLCMLYSG